MTTMRYGDQLTLDEERGTARKELFTKLVALACDLLEQDAQSLDDAGQSFGVTFYDVRVCAETRGLLNGEEKQPVLSFGSSVMAAAKGVSSGWRRTKHDKSHRRLLAVYRLQQVLDANREAGTPSTRSA